MKPLTECSQEIVALVELDEMLVIAHVAPVKPWGERGPSELSAPET